MMHSDPTESLEERLARYGVPLRTTLASPAEVAHRRRSYRRSVLPAAAVVAAAVLAGGLLAQRSEVPAVVTDSADAAARDEEPRVTAAPTTVEEPQVVERPAAIAVLTPDNTVTLEIGVQPSPVSDFELAVPSGFVPVLIGSVSGEVLIQAGPDLRAIDPATRQDRLVAAMQHATLPVINPTGVIWGADIAFIDDDSIDRVPVLDWQIVDLADGTKTPVARTDSTAMPIASWDGSSLLLRGSRAEVHVLQSDGSHIEVRLEQGEVAVALGPDVLYTLLESGVYARSLLETATIREVGTTAGPDLAYTGSAALSPSGQLLALATKPSERSSAETITILDVDTSEVVASVDVEAVSSMFWSDDSRWLIIGSSDEGSPAVRAVSSNGVVSEDLAVPGYAGVVVPAP